MSRLTAAQTRTARQLLFEDTRAVGLKFIYEVEYKPRWSSEGTFKKDVAANGIIQAIRIAEETFSAGPILSVTRKGTVWA